MLVEHAFGVRAPIVFLWAYLLDVERIAPCLPGAELTEILDERRWKGKVNMRFGPVAKSFAGTVTMDERDDVQRRVVLSAKGTEQKGKGTASAVVTARLEPGSEEGRDHGKDAGRHLAHRHRRPALSRPAASDIARAHAAIRGLLAGVDDGRAGQRRGRPGDRDRPAGRAARDHRARLARCREVRWRDRSGAVRTPEHDQRTLPATVPTSLQARRPKPERSMRCRFSSPNRHAHPGTRISLAEKYFHYAR